MKWPRRILALLVLLVVGFGVFGAAKRQTYPETTAQPNYMENLMVATLNQDGCSYILQNLQEKLPRSPIILRVTPTTDLIPIFYAGKQKFVVEEVYAGDSLKVGEEIWVVSGSWCAVIDHQYRQMAFYFVNTPKQGQEYLIFLSRQLKIVDGFDPLPVYQLQKGVSIDPVFCYNDLDTQVDAPPGQPLDILVPYREVADQEFFAESQAIMDAMVEAKHALLEQYPR